VTGAERMGTTTGEVCEGRDGWLFLIGGSNRPGKLYDRNAPRLPDAKLRKWVKLIETRAARFERMGTRYVHMVIPEKLTVYDDKLRKPIVDWKLSPALRLGEMLQHSPYRHVWLDLVHPFRAARDQIQLYLKTDSHWNAEGGCFFAYRLLCDHIGIKADLELLSRPYLDFHANLDLGRKIDPPIAESFRFYDMTKNATRWYCSSIAEYLEAINSEPLLHRGAHVAFKNDAPSAVRKKILIFGDSSASQRADLLTGMLAETVTEVEFIWSSNLDWHYIRKAKPDVVVYEMVERFLTKLPRDRLNLFTRSWVHGNVARWLQSRSRRGKGA
jgi:alginate O-acetyltransferase complex protein AlgJ